LCDFHRDFYQTVIRNHKLVAKDMVPIWRWGTLIGNIMKISTTSCSNPWLRSEKRWGLWHYGFSLQLKQRNSCSISLLVLLQPIWQQHHMDHSREQVHHWLHDNL
jgi:hypothetical protein